MELHVGLDVSLETTSLCIVDETGKKVLETSVASDPEAICIALRPHVSEVVRVGIEACSTGMRLSYTVMQGMDLSVGARNLFDDQYRLVDGFPEPGRSFYVGARARY